MRRGFKYARALLRINAIRKISCIRHSTCRCAFNSVPFAGTLQKIRISRRGI